MMNGCVSLAVHVCIYVHSGGRATLSNRKKNVLVEPPASLVFLGAVSLVVVIVPVVGAELHALVTGPL